MRRYRPGCLVGAKVCGVRTCANGTERAKTDKKETEVERKSKHPQDRQRLSTKLSKASYS